MNFDPESAVTTATSAILAEQFREAADAHADRGEFALAAAGYRQALDNCRTNYPSLHNLGSLYWQKAEWSAAEACFRQLVLLYPGDVRARALLARVLHNQGDWPGSFDTYQALARMGYLTAEDACAYLLAAERVRADPSKLFRDFTQFPGWEGRFDVRERAAFFLSRTGRYEMALACLTAFQDCLESINALPEPPPPISEMKNSCSGVRIAPAHLTREASRLLAHYMPAQTEPLVIDDFFSADAVAGLRETGLSHNKWRTVNSGNEAVASLSEGLVNRGILEAMEEIRGGLQTRHDGIAAAAIWFYRYFANDLPPQPHADDGCTSVNVWLTPDRFSLDGDKGGLFLWPDVAPSAYFQQPGETQARMLAMAGLSPPLYIPYQFNRAVVFHGRRIHQTSPYAFIPRHEGRRMNVTFLFS